MKELTDDECTELAVALERCWFEQQMVEIRALVERMGDHAMQCGAFMVIDEIETRIRELGT